MLNKVLVLGSGALSIGQAGEFDYSGSQCIKALKEEGIKTILINPNIATIQTSENLADKVYFLPITTEFVTKIIEKEKPDGLLLSFGGQTALNCGVELYKNKILEKYFVKILGTPIESIIASEDRKMFVNKLNEININTAISESASNIQEAIISAEKIGYPVILRAAYALGGLGSGFCFNKGELIEKATKAFSYSNQVLVEESLKGWKEVEYEVVRDNFDNCLTVCNMENFDPLGIHTGESIVVAPSQTLSDKEYHMLRRISIDVAKHLKIVGECNIQFALDPRSEKYRVIELNARLSRSSALASKATGYPLAFVAAKLSLGFNLKDIKNPITKETTAFFEPALDYIALKMPRWDTEKFKNVNQEIGTSMKSVGEVMALGKTFEEVLQKAIRMSNNQYSGLIDENIYFEDLEKELINPTHKRIFAIAQAISKGMSIEHICEFTDIDKWFLDKIKNIIDLEKELNKTSFEFINRKFLKKLKQNGFSDKQIAKSVLKSDNLESELKIRNLRKDLSVLPGIKQIDTLAAEYPAKTNYLYVTYNGSEDDIFVNDKSIIVLGSGPYSIGSSVEFDWCSVNCVSTLRKLGRKTVVINYNPETVSTDYDESDRLYFEELSFERVMDIYEKENPEGVIVSMGGQIPNNLARVIHLFCVKVLGTDPRNIDLAENRHKFSVLLDKLKIDQPGWKEVSNLKGIKEFVSKVGYPVLIRPSYVLSGSAMSVVYEEKSLEKFLNKATKISNEYPVVVTKFIEEAKEIEVDIVAKEGKILAYAISEHIEHAGVHSGDATLVAPAQNIHIETIRRIKKISKALVEALNVTGPINIQVLSKDNQIKIIECNLRASRTFPFISKVYKINFIDLATKAIVGEKVEPIKNEKFDIEYLGVKAPQFSFTRLHGADPILGVEMTSTGEVACFGDSIREAFLKSLLSTGFKLPIKKVLLSTGNVKQKSLFLESVKKLQEDGCVLYATPGTAEFYSRYGIKINILNWPLDNEKPNVLDYLQNKDIDLVVNIPKNNDDIELSNDYLIRRTAADFSIPLITNLECARLFVDSVCNKEELKVKSWDEYTTKFD